MGGEVFGVTEQEALQPTTPQQTVEPMASRPSQFFRSPLVAIIGFILLQSACAAVTAFSSLRLLIGLGSLAAATAGIKLLVALHADAIRIPMVLLALMGSAVNLYVLWRIRSLRARPASAWRVAPATAKTLRNEAFQIALSILTLLLVLLEYGLHLYQHGGI
jgi:hypothetical protein